MYIFRQQSWSKEIRTVWIQKPKKKYASRHVICDESLFPLLSNNLLIRYWNGYNPLIMVLSQGHITQTHQLKATNLTPLLPTIDQFKQVFLHRHQTINLSLYNSTYVPIHPHTYSSSNITQPQ